MTHVVSGPTCSHLTTLASACPLAAWTIQYSIFELAVYTLHMSVSGPELQRSLTFKLGNIELGLNIPSPPGLVGMSHAGAISGMHSRSTAPPHPDENSGS